MKVVAVIGSPKGRGSGFRILRKIEENMKVLGPVEFEYLFLKEANLKSCLGCYNCMARGEDKCPLKDDRALIEQTLESADGIILSSPVCVNNVSAPMKNFIDRFAYLNHRPKLHRQRLLTVVNMGGTEGAGALAALKISLGYARAARVVQELVIATPPWLQTQKAIEKKEAVIASAAQKFYQDCLNASRPRPTFASILDFYFWKRFAFECRQALPADHAFYQERTYYYDAKLNPFLVAVAKAIAGVMMSFYVGRGLGPGLVSWPTTRE